MASVCTSPGRWGQKPRGPRGSVTGSLTCSRSTAHSGRARIRTSSLEDCWGSARRPRHACRGSGDTRPHTFFQSSLWGGQGQRDLYTKASLHPTLPEADSSCRSAGGSSSLPSRSQEDRLGKHGRQAARARGGLDVGCSSWVSQTPGRWGLSMNTFDASPPTEFKGGQ